MKKLLTILGAIIILAEPVFASSQPLLPANFVEISNGVLAENTLLASDDGKIFIEFSKETKFVSADGKVSFSGEILPPQSIELDIAKPRGLMQELATFEMVSNSGTDIVFLDKYDKITRKNLFRQQLLNPEGLKKSAWVKLVYLANDPLITSPKLWEWQGENDGWKRIGGNLSEAGEDGAHILSAILRRTGIYAIFDENPPPRHFADEYEINTNSSPKNIPSESFADSGLANSPDISQYAINDDNEFHSSGEPPLLEYDNITPPEVPSTNTSKNTQLLQALQIKVTENSARIDADPKIKGKIESYIAVLKDKVENESKESLLTNKLNSVTQSLSQAESAEEKENLEKTFLELQTGLYKLKNSAPDKEEFITLQQEVDNFFAGIPLSQELQTNIIDKNTNESDIDRSPPPLEKEDELYIPENAQLTQSGSEESQNISWAFPVFLLVCFGLLGWGIFSTKKKKTL